MERSGTLAKNRKCSKLVLHFAKPGLVKGKVPDRLTLPWSPLPGSSPVCSHSCLKLGNGSIHSIQKWNYCCASIVSYVPNMKHFRWAKVAFFGTILPLAGQRWQTEINTDLSIPNTDKLQGMRTESGPRETLSACPEIPESLLAESVSTGEHWWPETGALRLHPFPKNVGENIPELFHAKIVCAIWNF